MLIERPSTGSQAGTSLSALLLSVQRSLNRSSDADVIAFGTALTEKDMLCQVATLTSSSSFDYYDLSLYRSKPCDDISEDEHLQEADAAETTIGDCFNFHILLSEN